MATRAHVRDPIREPAEEAVKQAVRAAGGGGGGGVTIEALTAIYSDDPAGNIDVTMTSQTLDNAFGGTGTRIWDALFGNGTCEYKDGLFRVGGTTWSGVLVYESTKAAKIGFDAYAVQPTGTKGQCRIIMRSGASGGRLIWVQVRAGAKPRVIAELSSTEEFNGEFDELDVHATETAYDYQFRLNDVSSGEIQFTLLMNGKKQTLTWNTGNVANYVGAAWSGVAYAGLQRSNYDTPAGTDYVHIDGILVGTWS